MPPKAKPKSKPKAKPKAEPKPKTKQKAKPKAEPKPKPKAKGKGAYTPYYVQTVEDRDVKIEFNNESNVFCTSFPNAVRRILFGEIHAFKIDPKTCKFTNTNTIYNSDILANKLYQIPFNQSIFKNSPENYLFTLDIENNGAKTTSILSSAIKIMDDKTEILNSDAIISPEPFILGYLHPGHKVHCTGKFLKNAVHPPVSQVSLVPIADPSLFKFPEDEELNDLDKKDYEILNLPRSYRRHDDGFAHKYMLRFTSEYMFPPKELFAIALNHLKEKLMTFKESLVETDFKVMNSTDSEYLEYHSNTETHTLFNLLQQYLLRHPSIKFAGYYQTHPLESIFILRIIANDDPLNIGNTIVILQETIDTILKLFS